MRLKIPALFKWSLILSVPAAFPVVVVFAFVRLSVDPGPPPRANECHLRPQPFFAVSLHNQKYFLTADLSPPGHFSRFRLKIFPFSLETSAKMA